VDWEKRQQERDALILLRSAALFVLTALAEILGCYLPYLWLRQGKSPLLVIPAAASLAAFVWLLTQHPTSAGRTYAAYGGVYIAVAMAWLWLVDKQRPTAFDIIGALFAVTGMAIIVLGAKR
jgi:small multidrug resistance family-3 protein